MDLPSLSRRSAGDGLVTGAWLRGIPLTLFQKVGAKCRMATGGAFGATTER